jgi:hypothetical protein
MFHPHPILGIHTIVYNMLNRIKTELIAYSFILVFLNDAGSTSDYTASNDGLAINGLEHGGRNWSSCNLIYDMIYLHGYVLHEGTASQGRTLTLAIAVTNDVTRFTSHCRCYARA